MNKTRKFWLDTMLKIVTPVLTALKEDRLKESMPVECANGVTDRENYTYLEAFGRTVVGMAPWLGCKTLSSEEEELRRQYAETVRECIKVATNEHSKDFMNFSYGHQPIVDAAFLAQGILRAPHELWEPLDIETKERLIKAMKNTRTRKPYICNWLLFSAMTEAFLHHVGDESWDRMRIDYALLKHMEWYKGDGWYSDGNDFHLDYYNSYVIQPMLIEILKEVGDEEPSWKKMTEQVWQRGARFATYLENFISPEGTYPLVGRSLTYRFGAFHLLSLTAYSHRLEKDIKPAQVRNALTKVIERTLKSPDNFDGQGWLTIGVCGHQPNMGENYISTGSLYLCSSVFLPLGLDENDEFWSSKDEPFTMQKLWSGENLHAKHAL